MSAEVKHDVAISATGSAGIFGMVTLSEVNTALGTIIAILSIAGLIPLVWSRWKKFKFTSQANSATPPDDEDI